MGSLRFGPTRGRLRSVYNVHMIREIYEDNPYSDGFRLTIKLGRGKKEIQTVSVGFKRFTGEDCLQTILGFATMMWALQGCGKKNRV